MNFRFQIADFRLLAESASQDLKFSPVSLTQKTDIQVEPNCLFVGDFAW